MVDLGKLNLLAILFTVVALGCGRTGLDDGFGTQNTTIGGAPDSGASATAGAGGHGGTLGAGGHSGAGGHPGAAGSGSASAGSTGTGSTGTGTIGGFGGTIRFCSSDVDCVAATPRCCPVGAVKVCEPAPCASNDEDNDDDSAEGHRR